MSHTYVSSLFHCVFSTRNREPLIAEDLADRLYPYLGGIVREHDGNALTVGGVADHVHLLLSLPATIAVAKMVQLVKGGSSKWVHETFPRHRRFAWQEGYGAFSVGRSQVEDTIRYIAGQADHHRVRTFQDEYRVFLEKNGLAYDERHVWG